METTKIHEGYGVYYFTFSIIHWLPVFISARKWMSEEEEENDVVLTAIEW
ncbi:MAG: hypothetical protein QNJ45_23950 [Ardenticatenaceae bacterium]|nr:hypothetical protein [Ardenticatenaceae bacterium]